MKRLLFLLLTTASALYAPAQKKAPKPKGYEIKVELKGVKNANIWLYLGCYYGKMMPISDSARVGANGVGVFRGKKKLPGGIYMIATNKSRILMELLIDKNQHFTISTDTIAPEKNSRFIGSPENVDFKAYTNYVNPKGIAAEKAKNDMRNTSDPKEKDRLQKLLEKNLKEMDDYRKNVIRQKPKSILSTVFSLMKEVEYPASMKNPKTRQDTLALFYYGKEHYWDGIDLMDGRLVRTPVFEKKLNTYLSSYVQPDGDSVIQEFNWMIALGRNDTEMFQYLIGYFVDNYYNPKYMGQDKVLVYLYQKYFATKQVNWLSEKQLKQIEERAMMLIANQLGEEAADLDLVDTAGQVRSMKQMKNDFLVVAFWDPNCGHCKTEIPRIDSFYKASWKDKNVGIYAVMSAETSINEWAPFIRSLDPGWVHVHQTPEMRAVEEKNNLPNYHQLYDVRTTPTVFLLDKEKRIIAKNLSLDDIDKVLLQKAKQDQQH